MARTLRACATAGLEVFETGADYARLQLFGFFARSGASDAVSSREGQPLLEQQQQRRPSYMDESHSEEFILSDGRKLGVAYYGAETGPAVFYLHGYPGCRLSGGLFFDKPGKELGARIIAVERPGLGKSSPQPGRRMIDHATDIGELAEHLKLASYGVIGVSGGGPYTLACAYALPAKGLKAISIIGGMGPIDVGTKGMNWGNWFYFKALLYFPFVMRLVQYRVCAVLNSMPNDKIIELARKRLSSKKYSSLVGPDVKALTDPVFLNTMLDLYREHYKQGVDGHMEDGRILSSDWDFRLQDIRTDLPIQMWYSKKDTNVPFRMGEAIAARLSSTPEFFVKEKETHLNLVLRCSRDALEHLLEKM